MAEGIAPAIAAELLDALFNSDAYDGPANIYVKLHTAAPGAAGTTAAATETTRKEVTFSAASSGAITSDAGLSWTNVAGTEDYTHFTLWDHISAGNFLWSGSVTANQVTAGDTFTVATGDVDITLGVAS